MMRTREDGEIAAEFALILPVLLFLIGLLLLLGFRGVYAALANAEVRQAARVASVRTGFVSDSPYPDPNTVCNNAQIPFPGAVQTACQIDNSPNTPREEWGTGDIVDVTITFQITTLGPIASFFQPLIQPGGPPGTAGLDIITVDASVMRE